MLINGMRVDYIKIPIPRYVAKKTKRKEDK